jgi:hypothetical protein
MEDQKKFHYEIKAPDRVFWHFRGMRGNKDHGSMTTTWYVEVTQEHYEYGLRFEMTKELDNPPSLIDVFSAFQAKVTALINPIAWEIHYHRNTGME